MPFLKGFIKLMKDELSSSKKKTNFSWVIDESKCLNTQEVRKLRKTCRQAREYGLVHKNFTAIRNWFMIELGLNAGVRVEEMSSLRHENLLIDKNRSSIIVTGKGGRKRAVWINLVFKKNCFEYLECKKKFGYGTDEDDPLLNNIKGNRISKRALQKFFKILVKKAGISEHYHIHCLRHTYTTFLLKASNYNYRFVQRQLGHSSIRTTQVYAGVIESEGRSALERIYK